jgi:5-methylcytosine-specific restriction endonuclease McrA
VSGDWIKMRCNLWDDPRVARICDLCECTEAPVVGALYWLWATADQHTEDGILPGLTLRQIDRKTGVDGFAAALCEVGWLADHPEGVRVVRFEEHNGASAKKRVETARRVAKHRASADADDDARLNFPRSLRDAVIARCGGACVYCGRREGSLGPMETKPDGFMHLDHVIPLTRGGADDESNLVAACRKCNMKKGDRTPDECGFDWPVLNGARIGNTKRVTGTDKSVTDALAREEKRREEEQEICNLTVATALRAEDRPSLALVKAPKTPDCPHLAVLALWAEVLPHAAQHLPSQWRGTRATHLRARWRETAAEKGWTDVQQGLTYLRKLFGYVAQSPFLMGRAPPRNGGRPFEVELAWLVNPTNWAKVLEGKFHAAEATA